MRFHVVGLPHTQVTRAFSWCAFTNEVRVFCNMMSDAGHEVTLYAGEETEARAALVPCITREEQARYFPDRVPPYDPGHPGWRLFNGRAAAAIAERSGLGDLVCISSWAQWPVAEAVRHLETVEPFIGYSGSAVRDRVFKSQAWRACVQGWQQTSYDADGSFYDAVVPYAFELGDFAVGDGAGGYLLYVGRLTRRKGLEVVVETAKRTGLPLVVAGFGEKELIPAGAEFVGVVGPAERARLMGAAAATLMPTLYVEAFGAVAVESQLCGTPAITTDWGAFPETVEHGVSGFRCSSLGEFEDAVRLAGTLDRAAVRRSAERFSAERVGPQFISYFGRLERLRAEERGRPV
jgi:glycosyltransferase involved in cell wall biosynthesis